MQDTYIYDKTFQMLEKSLDISTRRQSLITGNIANIDTIHYKPKDLDFRKTLEKAVDERDGGLVRTNPGHLKSRKDVVDMSGEIRVGLEGQHRLDSVDIDTEMTNLMENNLKYRTSVELLLRKIGILRQAITEGTR